MDKGQFKRRDRLVKEKRHDTYREGGKWPEPTICTECKAVFTQGRWTWKEEPLNPKRVICPACQRIRDNYPAGRLVITGDFIRKHRSEILNLIHNEEEKERGEHALERIMNIEEDGEQTVITTTGIHIARRIGEAVAKAYQGELDFQYGDGEKTIKLKWNR